MLAFSSHAFVVGSQFSRLPEIQKSLALSEADFGLTLMGFTAGVFLGASIVSGYLDGLGPRRILMFFLPVFAATPLLEAHASGPYSLCATLFAAGMMLAVNNIAMNVEADRFEAATGHRIMNKCHGMWGVGFLIITSLAAAAIAAGISPVFHFAILFCSMVVFSTLVLRRISELPARESSAVRNRRRFAVPTRSTFLILGFGLSGMWLEGSTRMWSVIYLRDTFGQPEWRAALGLTAIITAQTAGRFLADGWIGRFGPITVARTLAVVAFTGLACIVFAGSSYVAFFGLVMIGLGISTAHPQSLSAVAQLGDRPASENVAALASLQTLVVFAGPPVFGLVASAFGSRFAFGLAVAVADHGDLFCPLPASAPTGSNGRQSVCPGKLGDTRIRSECDRNRRSRSACPPPKPHPFHR